MKNPGWFEKIAGSLRSIAGKHTDLTPASPDIFGLTTTGKRPANEDSILIVSTDAYHLIAVADGLGGHAAGDYASNMAIRILEKEVTSAFHDKMEIPEIKAMLRDIYTKIHEAIEEESTGERKGMGTTLVSAIIRNKEAVIGNTGDSRAYLVHEKVVQLTKDHSVVQSLIDEEIITEEQAINHPLKNLLSSSLGGASFQVDLYHAKLVPGRMLLLCSDGFSGYMGVEEMVSAAIMPSAEEIVRRLVQSALENGSEDNVSVVAYRS
ncbi:serine/threonine-protein phosphatase [Methanocalculus taiwanensis]|uniref:Serine/threonine-protein phosphatase n=1 Tax=Methanocalculus taiwanensis TaxID=106207 RepID=A0ABD4TN07_9EURY|nr:protein phosphatase 2C domain-containing protein [Methanocalculus taiwanensis]MCQ1539574.1 serine/threonine-protein phosphatase [Methanocalculus taiwanensis]